LTVLLYSPSSSESSEKIACKNKLFMGTRGFAMKYHIRYALDK
jgi:hypothetical protein